MGGRGILYGVGGRSQDSVWSSWEAEKYYTELVGDREIARYCMEWVGDREIPYGVGGRSRDIVWSSWEVTGKCMDLNPKLVNCCGTER